MKDKQNHTIFAVLFAIGWVAVSPAESTLRSAEAREKLRAYEGRVERLRATFPEAVSEGPLLTSVGPSPVDETCYAAWREALETLKRKGYLCCLQEGSEPIGLVEEHLTPKGEALFSRLAPGSFYGTLLVMPELEKAELQVTKVGLAAGGDKARVEFQARPTEPFSIMWEAGLFAADCRAEVAPEVALDHETVRGHAHFRFDGEEWHVEKVLLGLHGDRE